MLELNVKKVGLTTMHDNEVVLVVEGEMPPDCVVVFMDKESWEKLKKELPRWENIWKALDRKHIIKGVGL